MTPRVILGAVRVVICLSIFNNRGIGNPFKFGKKFGQAGDAD